MKTMQRIPTKALIDAVACALCFGLFAIMARDAAAAAEEAVRLYGRNVDSGVWLYIAGWYYFLPAGTLFLAAAISLFFRMKPSRFLHGIAWGWLALPLVVAIALDVHSLLAS